VPAYKVLTEHRTSGFLMHYLHCSVFREHSAAFAYLQSRQLYMLSRLLLRVNIFFLGSTVQPNPVNSDLYIITR